MIALLCAAPAGAQGRAVLRGKVVEQATGVAVQAARVVVDERYVAEADWAGRFVVDELDPGDHLVRVERLGYAPSEILATFGDSLYLVVELRERVEELPGVIATSKVRSPALIPERMKPFYRRRDHGPGGGRFIDRDGLEQIGSPTLVDVLRRLPGTRIIHAGAAMEDYLATGGAPGPHALTHAPQPCYAQIFVNGLRMFAQGHGTPPDLNLFNVNDIEALEYYAQPSATPVEFRTLDSDCGTLVLWTRLER
ncbi:MAG TPA: Plug domain-containing protein [Longimicrobium sp.]|nr:Plug domain-containing protein [Longimicrobium sp.]